MKQFEIEKFNTWNDKAKSTILNSMKGNLLKMTPLTEDKCIFAGNPIKKINYLFGNLIILIRFLVNMQKHLVAKINGTSSIISQNKDFRMQDSISGGKSLHMEPSNLKIKSDGMKSWQLTNKLKCSTSSNMGGKQMYTTKRAWMEMINNKIMVEHQLCFEINFDLQVFEIIHEAELLEQLGFELSISLRDLCIQKDRLKSDIKIIQAMIEEYNEIMYKLDIADVRIFCFTLQHLMII